MTMSFELFQQLIEDRIIKVAKDEPPRNMDQTLSQGIETIFTMLAAYHDIIPPTINFESGDEECDLDYVPNVARKTKVDIAMSNSFGFGGTNATIIVGKYKP